MIQLTFCLNAVFVSPTTNGNPLTNRTMSNRALFPGDPNDTSSATANRLFEGFSKSISRTGRKASAPTNLCVCSPRSQDIASRLVSTRPSSSTWNVKFLRSFTTSDALAGTSATSGLRRTSASTTSDSMNTCSN